MSKTIKRWQRHLEQIGCAGLEAEYRGEGPERQVTIRGRFKNDPRVYELTSPKLKDVHPGHVIEIIDGKSFTSCKGSPLWDYDPDTQLWYDTTRDWLRMHCPEVFLFPSGGDE